jgi:uncharacterized membrane protein
VEFVGVVETVGRVLEAAGVAIIAVGAVVATLRFLSAWRAGATPHTTYRTYRTGVAQAILLGLEFLVAGDIIRSVVIEPTFTSVGVLAIIVLIRTFLSLELTLEIEGRWPWQRAEDRGDG